MRSLRDALIINCQLSRGLKPPGYPGITADAVREGTPFENKIRKSNRAVFAAHTAPPSIGWPSSREASNNFYFGLNTSRSPEHSRLDSCANRQS